VTDTDIVNAAGKQKEDDDGGKESEEEGESACVSHYRCYSMLIL
jgi:hypothetical protein